jgi:hypothetical protein
VCTIRSYEPVPNPDRTQSSCTSSTSSHKCSESHTLGSATAVNGAVRDVASFRFDRRLSFVLPFLTTSTAVKYLDSGNIMLLLCAVSRWTYRFSRTPIRKISSYTPWKRHFGQWHCVGVCTGTILERASSTFPLSGTPRLLCLLHCQWDGGCGRCALSSPGSAHRETRLCTLVRSALWVRCETQSDRNLERRARLVPQHTLGLASNRKGGKARRRDNPNPYGADTVPSTTTKSMSSSICRRCEAVHTVRIRVL